MSRTAAPKGPTELSRKITVATVAGGYEKWFDKLVQSASKSLELMSVYGFANGAKVGASEYGEFIKLLGNFRAVNLDTGEIINAPVVILPTYIGEALKAALDNPDRTGPVQFAFKIIAKYDVTSVTKYVYVIHDLMPPQQNDPLSTLGQAIGYEKQQALELSSAAAEPAPAEPTPVAQITRKHK